MDYYYSFNNYINERKILTMNINKKKIVISQQSWNLEQYNQLFLVFQLYIQTNKQKHIHTYIYIRLYMHSLE